MLCQCNWKFNRKFESEEIIMNEINTSNIPYDIRFKLWDMEKKMKKEYCLNITYKQITNINALYRKTI